MAQDMVIQVQTFNLLAWLLPKAEKFPRVYRFTITQRLMNSVLDFQENLILAKSQRGNSRYDSLLKCDANLQQLRLYLRLAHHWQWLSDGQYKHVSEQVSEIGRLLGGWIKQTRL